MNECCVEFKPNDRVSFLLEKLMKINEIVSVKFKTINETCSPFVKADLPAYSCKECNGNCCNIFTAEVFTDDIISWLKTDKALPLLSLGASTSEHGETSIFINRKEDFLWKRELYSDKYLMEMHLLNPSLGNVKEEERKECVFFNRDHCVIHNYLPLSCRCYPYSITKRGRNYRLERSAGRVGADGYVNGCVYKKHDFNFHEKMQILTDVIRLRSILEGMFTFRIIKKLEANVDYENYLTTLVMQIMATYPNMIRSIDQDKS